MIGSWCATTRNEGIVLSDTLLEGKKRITKLKTYAPEKWVKNIHLCRLNQGMQNLGKRKEEAVCMLDAGISWWWKIVSQGA